MPNTKTWTDPDTTNNEQVPGHNPLGVYLLDPTTTLAYAASGGGGGTQYTDGAATPANPIGTAIAFDNGGTIVDVASDHPLPVSGSFSAATPADLTASGSLTAAQPTPGTVVAGGTVTLALGTGIASWAVDLRGTFSAGTTVLFEGRLDASDWIQVNGVPVGVTSDAEVNSVVGGSALQYQGNATGLQAFRVRASALQAADSVAVVIIGSTAPDGGFLTKSLPPGTANIGKVNSQINGVDPALGTADGIAGTSVPLEGTGGWNGASWDRVLADLKALRVSLYGKNAASGDTPLNVDSSGRIVLAPNQTVEIVDSAGTNKLAVDASGRLTLVPNSSMNIAQIGGVTTQMASANGVAYANVPEQAIGLDNGTSIDKLVGMNGFASTESMISYFLRKGQSFGATTGKLTSPAAGTQTLPLVLLNPASSTKNILIYSIKVSTTGGTNAQQVTLLTSDPAFTALPAANIANLKIGSSTTSVASLEYNNTTTQTVVGNPFDSTSLTNNASFDFLSNGTCILLPAGQAGIQGIGVWVLVSTASSIWQAQIRWLEY